MRPEKGDSWGRLQAVQALTGVDKAVGFFVIQQVRLGEMPELKPRGSVLPVGSIIMFFLNKLNEVLNYDDGAGPLIVSIWCYNEKSAETTLYITMWGFWTITLFRPFGGPFSAAAAPFSAVSKPIFASKDSFYALETSSKSTR